MQKSESMDVELSAVESQIAEERSVDPGQTASVFEAMIDSSEMDFISKLMPKGYSLTTSFRTIRHRAIKFVG